MARALVSQLSPHAEACPVKATQQCGNAKIAAKRCKHYPENQGGDEHLKQTEVRVTTTPFPKTRSPKPSGPKPANSWGSNLQDPLGSDASPRLATQDAQRLQATSSLSFMFKGARGRGFGCFGDPRATVFDGDPQSTNVGGPTRR